MRDELSSCARISCQLAYLLADDDALVSSQLTRAFPFKNLSNDHYDARAWYSVSPSDKNSLVATGVKLVASAFSR